MIRLLLSDRMRIAIVSLLGLLAGCPTRVARVQVPTDPSRDTPPRITISAVPIVPDGPGAPGDLEPGKAEVSTTTSVEATRGSRVMLIANAVNPGGVQRFTLDIAQRGATILQASATETKDAAGTALNTLTLRAPDAAPQGTLTVLVDDPVTVTATATNFNGQSSSIIVTYVPADLTVTIVADPVAIGYQAPAQSTLRWQVLHAAPPVEITGNMMAPPVPAVGSLTVAPSDTTKYWIRAKDRSFTRTASVTVGVQRPPPPPAPKLSAAPNNGRNCLGTENTVTWSVTDCGTGCDVTLIGKGRGYASGFNVTLQKIARSGSFTIKPKDPIDFTLTATSPFGTRSTQRTLTIEQPQFCGGSTMPAGSLFYFAVKASDPAQVQCQWHEVYFDTEANAKTWLEAVFGSSYTITAISFDDFQHQRRCP